LGFEKLRQNATSHRRSHILLSLCHNHVPNLVKLQDCCDIGIAILRRSPRSLRDRHSDFLILDVHLARNLLNASSVEVGGSVSEPVSSHDGLRLRSAHSQCAFGTSPRLSSCLARSEDNEDGCRTWIFLAYGKVPTDRNVACAYYWRARHILLGAKAEVLQRPRASRGRSVRKATPYM
jgi:hypothetical protein